MANPCETCDSIACCTHLSLHSFEVATLRDLDYARYVLGFERMVLGITPGGTWHVYYRYPCRYLDRAPGAAPCTAPTASPTCARASTRTAAGTGPRSARPPPPP